MPTPNEHRARRCSDSTNPQRGICGNATDEQLTRHACIGMTTTSSNILLVLAFHQKKKKKPVYQSLRSLARDRQNERIRLQQAMTRPRRITDDLLISPAGKGRNGWCVPCALLEELTSRSTGRSRAGRGAACGG
jgi:hypothetical protein